MLKLDPIKYDTQQWPKVWSVISFRSDLKAMLFVELIKQVWYLLAFMPPEIRADQSKPEVVGTADVAGESAAALNGKRFKAPSKFLLVHASPPVKSLYVICIPSCFQPKL